MERCTLGVESLNLDAWYSLGDLEYLGLALEIRCFAKFIANVAVVVKIVVVLESYNFALKCECWGVEWGTYDRGIFIFFFKLWIFILMKNFI